MSGKKVEQTLKVIPQKNFWTSFFKNLKQFSKDFMRNREQPEQQTRK